jgi:hypothetical protein
MIKTKISTISTRVLYSVLSASLLLAYLPNTVSAAQMTARKVTIGSSDAGAYTTYAFTFTLPSTGVIKSASFKACTTASGVCTLAPGFADAAGVNGSALAGQPTNLGDAAGWAVDTTSVGILKIKKTGNVAAPTAATPTVVTFSNVKNPNSANSTFFIRMATFGADDYATTPLDDGVVAASTAGQITVTASVDETLTFTLADATVALGTLTAGATGTGTSSMTVATNGTAGYSVAYTGTTLTSGADTIAAMATRGASHTGDGTGLSQFGINLRDNTTPNIGADRSGIGAGGSYGTDYGTADEFKFLTGDSIATSAVPTNANTFTTSYIANVASVTPAGFYSTVITYIATANF